MADKKISDLTLTTFAPGDEVEIYRPSSPTADLRVLLAAEPTTYQAVTAAEAEAGYTITRTSANILVELTEDLVDADGTFALPTGVLGDRVRLVRHGGGSFAWARTGGGDSSDVLNVRDDELEYQCIVTPSTWVRSLIRRHGAAVTTLTETTGAVDLVLVPDQHNYFISNVDLTGELVWNLPSAAEWNGVEVTAVRSGGASFDLVLNGASKRLRKGEMITVVADGTVWASVENRRGFAQVRETSNAPVLDFATHSGKLAMLTSGTAIACKLKDTSPTDSTYWVMVESNASTRTITFAAADGADGDGTTIRNPGAFTVPANTPWLFLVYVSANSNGASAIYQVADLSGGTGGGGGSTEGVLGGAFNPASITIANSLTSYDQYDQGSGTLNFSFNNAGSTIHLGESVVYFNSNGNPLTWDPDIVDGVTGSNADLPATLPAGIQKFVFVYDETPDRCEVYWPRGAIGIASVSADPAPVLGGTFNLNGQTIIPGASIGINGARNPYLASDSGKTFYVHTTAGTQTIPTGLPDGWTVEIWNTTGSSLSITGATSVTLAAGEVATLKRLGATSVRVAKGDSVTVRT